MKKLLLIPITFLFVILLSSSVMAEATIFDDTDPRFPEPTLFWKVDNDCTDEKGEQDCTTGGSYDTDTPFAAGSTHSLNLTDGESLDTNFNGIPASGNYTISMWVKPMTLPDFSTFAGTGAPALFELWYYVTNNWFIQRVSGGVTHKRSGGTPIVTGAWSHMVLRSNGSTAASLDILINGTKVGLGTVQEGAGTFQTISEDWYLLDDSRGVGEPIRGYVDDIVIWNETALNDSQIEILFNGSYSAAVGGPETRINLTVPEPPTETQYPSRRRGY